jgi:hypothetical protein
MKNIDTHKIFKHGPRLPEKFIKLLYKIYQDPTKTSYNVHPSTSYVGRTLTIGEHSITSTQSTRYPVQDQEFIDWIKKNIVDSWTECGLSITYANNASSVHGAHTDHTRDYVLLYVLDSGGDDVSVTWYQEHGYPLYRSEHLGRGICDYSTLDLIERIRVPEHTWAVYNVKILHGVENITQNRITLQLGLTDQDFQKITLDRI